jgi:ABC-type transport system substrate-binding protein/class 3 adenylate cyclase
VTVPTGERRVVSVLVADIVGSTAIAERLGPERSKFLLDEVVRLMRAAVERFGGTVAQLTGDGVLVLFGAPTAHEDDSERAVHAALAVQEAVGHFAGEVEEAYGIELAARVAVNTGPVVISSGDLADEERYNALGDTVNVAARLQTAAGEGGVAVGPATARQVEDTFELEPLGGLELKGKETAVVSFRVTGVRDRGEGAGLGRMVGRQRELEFLDEVLAGLSDGRGAVVVITGEPGIGKSRLKSEARKPYKDEIQFLEGHGVSYAESIPYWPIRELVRAWLGLGISDPETRLRIELRAALAQAGVDEAYPFLAALLGVMLEPDETQRLHELSRDSVRQQTVDAVSDLVCALAHEQPLCLVLDDLHWADEATLGLLEELLPLTEHEAVALLLLYRSEREHAAWELGHRARQRYPHRFLELELGPLDPEATRELVDTAAGGDLPASVAELLGERAGGNPFFLEEALRDLLERGALRRSNGHLELAVDVDELALPAAIQEALQARLDRLDPTTRDVLGVAAVVGRSFGMPLLEHLTPPEQLLPALSELQRLELVVEERRRPWQEYRFRHGLIQEAAYGSLVETRRRELHRSVGDALEVLHGDAPEVYGILARHFAEAEDARRAIYYLLKAGDAARALYADEDALDSYRRALGFLRESGDEARARETLFKIALTHQLAFDFERANQAYERAFALRPPESTQLAPTERLDVSFRRPGAVAPGYSYEFFGAWFVQNLFRGLLKVDRELNVVPELAEDVRISADGRAYSFRLEPGLRWSDGAALTAGDFVLALEEARRLELPTNTTEVLADIESAEARDDLTLEVRLAVARSYFPYLVALWWHPWPRHRWEELADGWRAPENLVCNGPFRLGELDAEHARLVANPHWSHRRGNVGEVDVAFYKDEELSDERWLEGQYDIACVVGRAALAAPATLVETASTLAVWFILFDQRRPPFDDEAVRRAFAHAIDSDALVVADEQFPVPQVAARRGGLLPPAMPGHSHRIGLGHDLEEARRLLSAAGYPGGEGLPEIKLVAAVPRLAAGVADQWRRLGVGVSVRQSEWHDQDEIARSEQAQCVLASQIADYPDPAGLLRWMRTLSYYFPDSGVEALLDRAVAIEDRDESLRAYQETDRAFVSESVSVVPLLYRRLAALRRPWVEGFWMNPVMFGPLDEVVVGPRQQP